MSFNDIGSTLDSPLPLSVTYIVLAFFSIALYNVAELILFLLLTFKQRKGLYFYSFFVATLGIAIYSIGFILKYFDLTAKSISYFYVTFIVFGWCMMVTGQSLVLYSRLHLILYNQLILRLVLGMIITNAIILHIPTIVLCYGANSPIFTRFATPYAVYERVQVSIFSVQELIISGLYIHESRKMLRSEAVIEIHGRTGKRLILHLLLVSLAVVALDICIVVLEFASRYASQTAAKGFIYSLKLKLEFNILNQLVDFLQRSRHSDMSASDGSDSRYDWKRFFPDHMNCPLFILAHRTQRAVG